MRALVDGVCSAEQGCVSVCLVWWVRDSPQMMILVRPRRTHAASRDGEKNAQIDLYGRDTHNWVYLQRELHKAWPMIIASLR